MIIFKSGGAAGGRELTDSCMYIIICNRLDDFKYSCVRQKCSQNVIMVLFEDLSLLYTIHILPFLPSRTCSVFIENKIKSM